MKVLVYRYYSICEPDVIATFREFGFIVDEYMLEAERKDVFPAEVVSKLGGYLQEHPADFVFSINFFPMVSEVCNLYHIRYISWVVDSPVMELFSESIRNEWNRTFVFDRETYNEIMPYHPEGVFHLPLGARIQEKEILFQNTPDKESDKYAHDISFVGSLYTEKNPYDKVKGLPEYLRGYFEGLMTAQMSIYGCFFIESLLKDEEIAVFKQCLASFYEYPMQSFLTDRITMAQLYMGSKITAMERIETFRRLSERFDTAIYTASDTSLLPKLHNMGTAKTLTEMPLIFKRSCININTTSKAIRSALPLRIFDILSCGGFVLSNYQSEIPEMFSPGEDLVVYTSLEEMEELAAYYLSHENERKEIAAQGYNTLRNNYTYEHQMEKMMLLAYGKMDAA